MLAGYIEMKSRSVVIYVVKYSGNVVKPSLHCCEKENNSNIAFLKYYCVSRAFHKFRLASSQTNYRQKVDSKHFSTKWLMSDFKHSMRFISKFHH